MALQCITNCKYATGRMLGPKMGNSIKCIYQGHSNALPHRESDQGFATFRLNSPSLY